MKKLFSNMNSREQQMVFSALVVIVLFSIYQVWSFFDSNFDELQHRVNNQQKIRTWMQQASREVKLLQGHNVVGERPKGKKLLLGLIDRTAKQNKLGSHLQKVQPEGKQGVRVWLEKATFDDVIVWLDTLQYKHGLVITDISFDHGELIGAVNVRALIEAP